MESDPGFTSQLEHLVAGVDVAINQVEVRNSGADATDGGTVSISGFIAAGRDVIVPSKVVSDAHERRS